MKKLLILLLITLALNAQEYERNFKPKALQLQNVSGRVFKKFAYSNNPKHYFVYDTFYILGYSSTKIAYIIEHDNDPADIFSADFVIQDLVRDKIVYKNHFENDNTNGNYKFSKYWNKKSALISKKLRNYGITRANVNFKPNKLKYKGDIYTLSSKKSSKYYSNFGQNFLISSKIYIKSQKKGKKLIDKKYYKHPSYKLARKPIGFLKLGNNKRAAVVVGEVTRGWEGPPHNLHIKIVGSHLKVGYKGK